MVNIDFSLYDFEYLLLILVRISAFIFIAPFFGQTGVPNQVKIGFSFFLTIILINVVPHPSLEYAGVIEYAGIVLQEGITGLLIGFGANICSSIVLFAGNIIDMDIGLSMATEFNADANSQVTITGNLYYYLVLLLLVTSNMHTYLIRAVSDSFSIIPVGQGTIEINHLLYSMLQYVSDMFVIGFRIFLPFFACMMILNCVLGIMAKVAPQMNMFSVGMQMKIIVGLLVLFFSLYMLPNIADAVFKEIKTMVVMFIESMY